MLIVHLLQSSQFSGAENVVVQIIRMFNSDNNVKMVYVSPNGPIEESLKEYNVDYFGINKLNVKTIKTLVKKWKPDIIHAHDVTASVIAMMATVGKKTRVISHMHVNNANMSKINFKTVLYAISSIKYSKIVWVSKSCYSNYRFRNIVKKKSCILDNVMNKELILSKVKRDTNLYDIDLIYVGRLTYQKNPERLVSVLKRVLNKKPDVKIAIVGNGDLFALTKSLIDKNAMNDSCRLVGYIDNPYKMIFDSRVLIMTSRYEGLPMTALEALALGVPIVSTPVDGMKNVVIDGYNGFLSDDDEVLADRVIELLDDVNIHQIMSANSRKQFDKFNNTKKYKAEMESLYFN